MTDQIIKPEETSTTSSHYLYSGNTVRALPAADMVSNRRLNTGTYEVQFHQEKGFYLNKIDDMLVPPEVYGDTPEIAKRVVTTFLDRGCNTGVLLEGEQGSGKTMLSKMVSAALRELDMPTIVINAPFCGPAFNAFMAAIDTPCAVLFDEFEKTYYKQEDKEKILTFFDGVFDSNKLIICTVNDKARLSTHMLNRPGRLFYAVSYNRLSLDVIEEYCKKNLKDASHIAMIKRVTTLYGGFNFDMLKALVEEMNRYNCTPKEALKFLNIRPSFTRFRTGTVFVPVGLNDSDNRIIFTDKSANPPVEDNSHSLSVCPADTSVSQEILDSYKDLLNGTVFNRDAMVRVLYAGIRGMKHATGRYGDRVWLENDDLLAYDGDTGIQTFEKDGFTIKYFPIPEADFKQMVEEAKAEVVEKEKQEEKEIASAKAIPFSKNFQTGTF